jgi:hypothetical protein
MERCSDLGIQGLREILVPDTNGVARPLCVSPEAELIALARSKGQVFDRPRSSAYSGTPCCGARSSKRRIRRSRGLRSLRGTKISNKRPPDPAPARNAQPLTQEGNGKLRTGRQKHDSALVQSKQ